MYIEHTFNIPYLPSTWIIKTYRNILALSTLRINCVILLKDQRHRQFVKKLQCERFVKFTKWLNPQCERTFPQWNNPQKIHARGIISFVADRLVLPYFRCCEFSELLLGPLFKARWQETLWQIFKSLSCHKQTRLLKVWKTQREGCPCQ